MFSVTWDLASSGCERACTCAKPWDQLETHSLLAPGKRSNCLTSASRELRVPQPGTATLNGLRNQRFCFHLERHRSSRRASAVQPLIGIHRCVKGSICYETIGVSTFSINPLPFPSIGIVTRSTGQKVIPAYISLTSPITCPSRVTCECCGSHPGRRGHWTVLERMPVVDSTIWARSTGTGSTHGWTLARHLTVFNGNVARKVPYG